MKMIFNINENMDIVCLFKATRNGFKHEGWVEIGGIKSEKIKINYLNRTWERYEFETLLSKILGKTLLFTVEEKNEILNKFI